MIITLKSGKAYDTDKDMTGAERHVLQKLLIWETMASSVDEFRRRKQEALLKGWNDSGPLQESAALRAVVTDLEEKVALRLDRKR